MFNAEIDTLLNVSVSYDLVDNDTDRRLCYVVDDSGFSGLEARYP